MADHKGTDKIHEVILDIFLRYAPEAPENALENIERKAGLKLSEVNSGNIDDFLAAMRHELMGVMEEWKAKFVTGVIRQMATRSFQ